MAWILKKNQLPQVFVALGVVVGLLLVIILGFAVYSLLFKNAKETERIDQTTYQAVFLVDKQIYFGKLSGIDSPFLLLNDVYYILVENDDPSTGRLVKLGQNEPHNPADQMIINRDHILFWENLKPDSRVIQTINSLKLNR